MKIRAAGDEDPSRLADRLLRLRWLPLEGIPICRPLEPLADPHVGYVMDLLEDMVAFRGVCGSPVDDVGEWYGTGGGLRRRLTLLARLAAILANLHDRGLVYSDVSPGNVLISAQQTFDEVWLVDGDNLQTESSLAGRPIGTPYYMAPELVRRLTGNTVHSDVYSFAVMAYETLTTNHPLVGDYVGDGPIELEEDALRGLVPWVDHSVDDVNRSSSGLSAEVVLTRRLITMFRRVFEDGMTDPRVRPGAGEWADALCSAADRCVNCTNCPHTYYAAKDRCPWCAAPRPPLLLVAVREQFPRLGDDPPVVLADPDLTTVLQPGRVLRLTERTLFRRPADERAPVVDFEWNGGSSVKIRNRGTRDLRRVPPNGGAGRSLVPGARVEEMLSGPWTLHAGSEWQPHRMLTIQMAEESGVR